jgi:hypothetical protein
LQETRLLKKVSPIEEHHHRTYCVQFLGINVFLALCEGAGIGLTVLYTFILPCQAIRTNVRFCNIDCWLWTGRKENYVQEQLE